VVAGLLIITVVGLGVYRWLHSPYTAEPEIALQHPYLDSVNIDIRSDASGENCRGVSGVITNGGSQEIHEITLGANLRDEDGDIIRTGSWTRRWRRIGPGQSMGFYIGGRSGLYPTSSWFLPEPSFQGEMEVIVTAIQTRPSQEPPVLATPMSVQGAEPSLVHERFALQPRNLGRATSLSFIVRNAGPHPLSELSYLGREPDQEYGVRADVAGDGSCAGVTSGPTLLPGEERLVYLDFRGSSLDASGYSVEVLRLSSLATE